MIYQQCNTCRVSGRFDDIVAFQDSGWKFANPKGAYCPQHVPKSDKQTHYFQNIHLGTDDAARQLKADLSDLRAAAQINVSEQVRTFLQWLADQNREALNQYRGKKNG